MFEAGVFRDKPPVLAEDRAPIRRPALVALVSVALGLVLAERALYAGDPVDVGSAPLFDDKRLGSEVSLYGDTNGVTVVTPRLGGAVRRDRVEVNGSYLADIVSAASVDIVSTASGRWQELRQEGNFGTTLETDGARYRLGGAASVEPDYQALLGRASARFEVDGKSGLLGVGYFFAHDTAGRTGTPFSVYAQELQRHGAFVAYEATLDKRTLLLLEASGTFESGDSKKPYRLLPVFSPDVATGVSAGASIAEVNQLRLPGRVEESVPLERLRFALSARLLRRFERSTFQSFARLYTDTWQLSAATAELRFAQDLGDRFRLVTHVRSTVQSGVSFWERAYGASFGPDGLLTLPRYRTGDRELSPLVFGAFGLSARYLLSSEDRPDFGHVGLFGIGTTTFFSDALFLRERASILVGLDWEQTFE